MLVGHADRSGSAALNPLTCPSAGTGSEKVLIRHYEIEEQGIATKSRGYDEHIKEITDPFLSHPDRRVDIF